MTISRHMRCLLLAAVATSLACDKAERVVAPRSFQAAVATDKATSRTERAQVALNTLLLAGDAPVIATVSWNQLRGLDAIEQLRSSGLELIGVNHAFRAGNQTQVGEFILEREDSPADFLSRYRSSTEEFLRSSIERSIELLQSETVPTQRKAHIELLAAFRARLAAFHGNAPMIYGATVRAVPSSLVALSKRADVRLVEPVPAQGRGRHGMPLLPPDVDLEMTALPIEGCCDSGGGGGGSGGDGGSTWTPPDLNNDWAPSHGKSWIDRDSYSKYTMQHVQWKFPGLETYKLNTLRFWYEHESIQNGTDGQPFYGVDHYQGSCWNNPCRGETWESNFPSAYLDSQALDNAQYENHAVGSNRPENFAYGTFYYTWIRYDRFKSNGLWDEVQINAQIGRHAAYGCTGSAWCNLTADHTVRVHPFSCSYRVPNSVHNSNQWRVWNYDGWYDKNRSCS